MQMRYVILRKTTLSWPRIIHWRVLVLFGLLVVGVVCACNLPILSSHKPDGIYPKMTLSSGRLIFTNNFTIFKLESGSPIEKPAIEIFTSRVSSPVFSPNLLLNDSKMVFTWSRYLPEKPADPSASPYYPRGLYLLDSTDNQSPNLLWWAHDGPGERNDPWPSSPGWTAGGQEVVFLIGNSEHRGIYKINADTLTLEQIHKCEQYCQFVSPSPTSNRLLFTSIEEGKLEGGIMSFVEEDGTVGVLFRDEGIDYLTKPSWSPDGSRIAFSMKVNELDWRGIFLLDTDGTDLIRLTQEEDGYYYSPVWSPDGKVLAFIQESWYGESGTVSQIILMDLQTQDRKTLITAPWHWDELQWVR